MSDILHPFFTFYGGKWRASKYYPKPKYDTIIEPFAGSAGYSLRYFDRKIILIEKDPIIAETWRYLIRVCPGEIRSLPHIDNGQSVDDFNICEEAKYIIGWWLGKGTSSPRKSPTSWMRSGTRPKSYWGNQIKERIANQVNKIKHWKIIEGDYSESPDIDATWFIDPPYFEAGKNYRYGSNKINYEELSEWCKSRLGQTIVCEQYGASWLPFDFFMSIQSNPSCCGKYESKEAIWTGEQDEENYDF